MVMWSWHFVNKSGHIGEIQRKEEKLFDIFGKCHVLKYIKYQNLIPRHNFWELLEVSSMNFKVCQKKITIYSCFESHCSYSLCSFWKSKEASSTALRPAAVRPVSWSDLLELYCQAIMTVSSRRNVQSAAGLLAPCPGMPLVRDQAQMNRCEIIYLLHQHYFFLGLISDLQMLLW
jgi:hypothetical protein